MTDIAALVKRLRWVKDWCHESTAKEAADALEACQARAEKAEAALKHKEEEPEDG